jgi:hypothetical protein
MAKPGIFCLEGNWETDLRQTTGSVRSLVELLQASGQIQAVYRDVGTDEDFEHYCKIWTHQKRYTDYAVGWFAFHGQRGTIKIGRRELCLDKIADMLGEGNCSGKSIHFDSCSTFAISGARLD